MGILVGYKTYIAALGFLGLGIYEMTQGNIEQGLGHFAAALTAFGLRSAIAR